MVVRGVAAHVDADLRKNGLGAEVVEARDGLHDLDALTKGVEIGLHLFVDPRDRPIEGVDLLQMELKQEAVVSCASRSSSGVALIQGAKGSPCCPFSSALGRVVNPRALSMCPPFWALSRKTDRASRAAPSVAGRHRR